MEDISKLEEYVGVTGVMLFFLSKRYFTSRSAPYASTTHPSELS